MEKWSNIIDKLGIAGEKKQWMQEYAAFHEQNKAAQYAEYAASPAGQAFAKIKFPKLKNMSTGLMADHWANRAARGVKGAPAMVVAFAAEYSRINLRSRRMQRKFAKNLRRYISEDAYNICYAKYLASPHMTRWGLSGDLVPVKAMSQPSGELFFLDIKYDDKDTMQGVEVIETAVFPVIQRILSTVEGDVCGIVEYGKPLNDNEQAE